MRREDQQPPHHDTLIDRRRRLPFVILERVVLRAKRLSNTAKLLYLFLVDYAGEEGSCFPGQARLALDLKVKTVRTVQRALVELRAAQLIDWKQQGLNRPNVYYLLPMEESAIWGREPARPAPTRLDTTPMSRPDTTPTSRQDTTPVSPKPDSEQPDSEEQQHPLTPADPPPEDPARAEDVVVADRSGAERVNTPGEGRAVPSSAAPPPASGEGDLTPRGSDVLGLATLTNDLIARGLAPKAAQKWLHERTPEYIRDLLAYFDWTREHRAGVIKDPGAWLNRALADPITFPEFYLKGREREALKQRRAEKREEQDRTALLDEARRRTAPIEERARAALDGWINAYQVTHHGRPPTQAQQDDWYARRLAFTREQDAEFFTDHPELRAQLAGIDHPNGRMNGHLRSSADTRGRPSS